MSGAAGRAVEDTFRAALEEAAAARGGDPEVRAAVAAVLERLSCGTAATLVAEDDADRWAVLGGVIAALRGRGVTAVAWPIGRRWGTALPLPGVEALVAALAAVDPAFDSGQRPATSEDLAHEARLRLSSEALRAPGVVVVVDAPEDAVAFSPGAILDADPEGGVRVLRSVRGGADGVEGIRLAGRGAAEQRPGTDGMDGLAAAIALALAQAALALPPERAAALAELAVVAAEEEPPGDGWGYFLLAQLGGVLSPGRAAQVLGWVLDAVTGAPLRSDMLWTGDGNDLRQAAPLLLRIGGDVLLVDAGEHVAEISARDP